MNGVEINTNIHSKDEKSQKYNMPFLLLWNGFQYNTPSINQNVKKKKTCSSYLDTLIYKLEKLQILAVELKRNISIVLTSGSFVKGQMWPACCMYDMSCIHYDKETKIILIFGFISKQRGKVSSKYCKSTFIFLHFYSNGFKCEYVIFSFNVLSS